MPSTIRFEAESLANISAADFPFVDFRFNRDSCAVRTNVAPIAKTKISIDTLETIFMANFTAKCVEKYRVMSPVLLPHLRLVIGSELLDL